MPLENKHTHNINNQIDLKNAGSDLDYRYGPYDSVQDALDHFPKIEDPNEGTLTLRGIGRTVLIVEGGNQREYWFKDGIEDHHLVPKIPDFVNITINEDGNWEIEGQDTGVRAIANDGVDGEDGEDGNTPLIGNNGNWWIGGIDTGLSSTGVQGDTGEDGDSAYDIWLSEGNTGTIQDFIDSLKGDKGDQGEQGEQGDEIELRVLDGYIQWKYEDQDASSWVNLISLEEISGDHPIFRVKNGWVQWKLSEAPQSEWTDLYEIESGGGTGVSIHNNLEEIQGGKPATETEEAEYYHLNQNQYDSLVAMLYQPKTVSFGVSPANGEKGVDVALTLNYNITANDDLIVSASINQGIGNVALMSGSVSGGTKKVTTSYILTIDYKDNLDVDKTSNHNTSYNAYVPQWYGIHKNDDITTYADLSSYLTKVIQSSSAIQQSVSPDNDYIYFVVTKANAKIFDQNNFEQTVGAWDDGFSEFYKKSITVTLQDNTTETLFVYRTRNMKTITQPFIYKIQ